ncbi:PREDICTED: IQ and ubiquitin-like domain-containing protein-like, partial [Elephantulus edwardii]|uniref:IQ and ubiquitin-like domain-containing protein-like n=1 Tax=Elephantulus edwardii TaxID=28737 RepID=UPI0003F09457
MSDQKENIDTENITDVSEKSSDALEPISIPVSTEDLLDSDVNGGEPESEPEVSTDSYGIHVELQESYRRLPKNDENVLGDEEVEPSPVPVNDHSQSLTAPDIAGQSPPLHPDDKPAFQDEIRMMKETLKIASEDLETTVKIVLMPVAQEILVSLRADYRFMYLKDYFADILNIPAEVLKMTCSGKILKNQENLLQLGFKPQDTVTMEISSTNQVLYPIKRVHGLSNGSKFITVRVETGFECYEDVPVEIVQCDFHKPFLGGFRHKKTKTEYHNAGTQTVPKKLEEKKDVFCRETQTVCVREKYQQTVNTTSTQMTKIGVYVSNMTDKLIAPGIYFTAEEYHLERLAAVIVLQTYYRQWHAKTLVKELKRQKKLREEWERQEELRKKREKEEALKMDYDRRHHPKTKEDFELLYNALEFWHHEQKQYIDQLFTGAERKAALCELLEKETQIISSVGRHRHKANQENQEASVQAFLEK